MEHCNVNNTGLTQYQIEQQEITDKFLYDYFFKYFDKNMPYEGRLGKSLELIISPRCNLQCKYCYVDKWRHHIFDENIFDEELTIKNLKLLLKWLEKNNYNPNLEIFSGELFAQEVGFKVMEIIVEHMQKLPPELRCQSITIPTNFTFICSEEATARVEKIRADLRALNIELFLSASFDGKYMEQNRPYKEDLDIPLNGKANRNDDYYDRAFDYIAKTCSGIHPMIYSQGIDKWKDNFNWFQEKMAEYNIPWDTIYLLQVRNQEWNQKQIKEYCDFLEYLFEYAWQKCNQDPERMTHFIISYGFNILGEPFIKTGRGFTCAIQSQFAVRVSDLMMYPCHRLGYKDFYFAQFVPDEEKILRVENKNTELLTGIFSMHKESQPYCVSCAIKHCCQGQCLGAQYESNRNIFAPIPSVCILSHATVAVAIKCLLKYDLYDRIWRLVSSEQREELEFVKKELEENNGI